MEYTREAVIDRLLRSYSSCYNIHLIEDDQVPITARCDFFEHSGKYVISCQYSPSDNGALSEMERLYP